MVERGIVKGISIITVSSGNTLTERESGTSTNPFESNICTEGDMLKVPVCMFLTVKITFPSPMIEPGSITTSGTTLLITSTGSGGSIFCHSSIATNTPFTELAIFMFFNPVVPVSVIKSNKFADILFNVFNSPMLNRFSADLIALFVRLNAIEWIP